MDQLMIKDILASIPLTGIYALVALALIGASYVLYLVSTFFAAVILPSRSSKLSVKAGSWAIVTGASDGIGREFALQLAKKQFNIMLISRNKEKLEAVATQAQTENPEIRTIVYPFDFTDRDESKYRTLKSAISKLDVGVLVNNVGVNHAIPIPFIEEEESWLENIVFVNIVAQMRMTRIVLPQMMARKAGFIINIGSMSAVAPCAYLSTYSATKSFLRAWSQTLAHEVKSFGVHVEHINTHFVTTNMSKIRKASFFAPTPKDYVSSVLATVGHSFNQTPYPSHALLDWVFHHFYTESRLISEAAKLTATSRAKALKRIAAANKKQ